MSRTYYLFSSGRLRRKDNTLVFEGGDGRRYLPIEDIDDVYSFGELDVNYLVGMSYDHIKQIYIVHRGI